MSDADQRQKLLPPRLRLDSLSMYIYHHFAHLHRADESAAWRYWEYEVRSPKEKTDLWTKFFKIDEMDKQFPGLAERIRQDGVVAVMAAAAARVVQECGNQVVLNRCSRCASLCRGPTAKQCFECGHDWHDEGSHD